MTSHKKWLHLKFDIPDLGFGLVLNRSFVNYLDSIVSTAMGAIIDDVTQI